jgi:nitrilase
MQHIALEGRCFVLAANQYVQKSDYPAEYQADLHDQPEVMCAGGSVIISPIGEVLAGTLASGGAISGRTRFFHSSKSKLDFDVTGHYARPDVFEFKVNKQPEMRMV